MILIIDDDPAIRSSLTFLLKRSGMDVTAASGPSEAMSVIRDLTPQVILMDMNFGIATDGTDGLRLLERMKAALPHVPVILMTAWGSIELAEKGTIFLDEIGELDPACQVKLLRVLQDQTYEVLGDSRQRKADVRVVCATNADLRQMIHDHTFREDLFYRINLITVRLPALRERKEDIPLLTEHFIRTQCRQYGFDPVSVKPDAMRFLMSLPYPGNIRELKNLVERTMLVSGKRELTADDFQTQYNASPTTLKISPGQTSSLQGLTLEEIERQTIIQSIRRFDGNLSQVAAALGISRGALYRRLEKYRIHLENNTSVTD